MNYQISSGQGPAECELAVALMVGYIADHHSIQIIHSSDGYNKDTFRSVLFSCDDDLSEYIGSVKWVCNSPYRPNHKRKNWFIDFSCCDEAEQSSFDESKIRWQTFRSSGNGGQHVNKVESGVRAIYLPTGQCVECTEERSQYANKRKAIKRLKEMIDRENANRLAQEKNTNWDFHNKLVRGNESVTFSGMKFRKIK